MTSPSEWPGSEAAVQTTLEQNRTDVGLVTRVISWVVDVLMINFVAIVTGVGAELVVSVFPITKNPKPLFVAVAGVVYVLWTAGYFVVFWSMSGQTPGSRVMQVRLVTPDGGRVKPARALVRWIGMNLAMVPLPWGYVPIPFQRLGFPDSLAHTRVIEAPELSIAEVRRQRMRKARSTSPRPSPPSRKELAGDRSI
jgi:uncharacterized RDD family membrane protein YckC